MIYGLFAEHLGRCIYESVWAGEESPLPNTKGVKNDVIQALKELKVPMLRWAGGCFADEYHWKDWDQTKRATEEEGYPYALNHGQLRM